VVFSGNGESFQLEVNGHIQNKDPLVRVEVANLFGPSIKVKVYPTDTRQPLVAKTIFNSPNAGLFYVYRMDSRGKYILEKTTHDWSGEVSAKPSGNSQSSKSGQQPSATRSESSEKSGTSGTPAATGCLNPLSDGEFQASLRTISAHPFDGPRLSSAKNLVKKSCLLSEQIRDILYLFDNESTRLDFAKFAYPFSYDPKNYEEVRNVLNPVSAEILDNYIK